MRGRDREAALVAVLADGEVHHLGAREPDVVDVAAGVERAADRGLGELLRGQPHVVPDGDARRLELVDVRTRDPVRPVGVELVGDDAAHVVGLEDSGVECHPGIVRPPTRLVLRGSPLHDARPMDATDRALLRTALSIALAASLIGASFGVFGRSAGLSPVARLRHLRVRLRRAARSSSWSG